VKKIPMGAKRWLQVLPYVLLSTGMGMLAMWWEKHHQGTGELNLNLSLVERVLIASRALWFYLEKLVWPVQLTFSYPKWKIDAGNPLQYIWLLACLIAAGCIWRRREKLGRGFIAAFVFFIATLMPTLGFIPLYTFTYTYAADHYQYLACIGPIAIFAAASYKAAYRWGWRVDIAGAIILLVLGVLSWKQCHVYKNAETIWRDTLKKNPYSWMAHNNLGIMLEGEGRADEAIEHYKEALQLKADHAEANNNLGSALLSQGKFYESIGFLRRAIEVKANYPEAYYNLGAAYLIVGRYQDAVEAFRKCTKIKPAFAEAYYSLGSAYVKLGRVESGVEAFKQAIKVKPNFAEAWCDLGAAYGVLSQWETAAEACKHSIKLKPDSAEAHCNLGIAFGKLGRWDEATGALKDAIKIRPAYSEAYNYLGAAYGMLGRHRDAIAACSEAVKLKPNFVDAHYNLGISYYMSGDRGSAIKEYKIIEALDVQKANQLLGVIGQNSSPR